MWRRGPSSSCLPALGLSRTDRYRFRQFRRPTPRPGSPRCRIAVLWVRSLRLRTVPSSRGIRPGSTPSVGAVMLKFDPKKVSREQAAQRLLQRKDAWAPIWSRFTDSAPGMHEPLVTLLAVQEASDPLLADPTVYPSANAREETELRAALFGLRDKPAAEATVAINELAKRHARRCEGPWAARGMAPLAQAVAHLAELSVTPPLPADNAEALGDAYATEGWRADWSALAAVVATAPNRNLGALATSTEDRAAVVASLRALYLPRLQREAELLQSLLHAGLLQARPPGEADTLLFVDGLRMDLAQHLARAVPPSIWTGAGRVSQR